SKKKKRYKKQNKKDIYGFNSSFKENKDKKKISYTEFVGKNKEEKIILFSPLLHLEHQKKIWLDQDEHFEEIYIWLRDIYLKHNPEPFADLKQAVEEEMKELDEEKQKRLEKINKDFENPLREI
ncbi:unnamed protein product, partial [marine sediment metagenome]